MSSVHDPTINQNIKIQCCNSSYAVDGDKSVWTVFADVNIALKKPTKLSSTHDPTITEGTYYLCCNSTYAVDGDKSNLAYDQGDFLCANSATVDNQQSWWAVDLQNVYTIEGIYIFGRTTYGLEQLANFDVEVIMPSCSCNRWGNLDEGDVFHRHYQATANPSVNITCPPNTRGRFVRIRRRDTKHLAICEVEVYSDTINSLNKSDSSRIDTAYACGYIGYRYVGPVIVTSVADSNIHCTIICFTTTACTAAEYDKNTHVCTLKGECMIGTQSFLLPDNDKDVFFIQ
ncbi:Hypothetical predicted protein [Mytilus galloprovincialis]|uniref:Fucolectin tachylectin-4 pentraxin-1 domain-containing protein n=1 Tax=Mytilus galloprovincialis TaxID=29158 RepID=A0A8B6FJK6_MYTGA|nr:Hypothetical predicted protein [Mytilus galloprovincialis]